MNRKIVVLDKPGRKEVKVAFEKEEGEVEILGLVLGEEEGKYELNVVMDHKVGNTKGRVEVRGFAKNGARVRVSGLVKIGKSCQKIDDFLKMKLLVLDDDSRATVEPKLEIESDDVKVGHAATVSRINEEQLFYLTSRGANLEKAEELLVKGFLKDITDKIKDDV